MLQVNTNNQLQYKFKPLGLYVSQADTQTVIYSLKPAYKQHKMPCSRYALSTAYGRAVLTEHLTMKGLTPMSIVMSLCFASMFIMAGEASVASVIVAAVTVVLGVAVQVIESRTH